jgi:uncharacterized protein YhbP (UPF0306 family)
MASEKAVTEVPQSVLDYLNEKKTLTLATASLDSAPRAATLLYINKGALLYVWVRAHSTTATHVEQNSQVSFAIDEYSEDWRQTKGVQGNGRCVVVLDGEEIAKVALEFGRKFPDLSSGSSTMGLYFLKIVPTELQFIDNTRGAGDRAADEFGAEFRRERIL